MTYLRNSDNGLAEVSIVPMLEEHEGQYKKMAIDQIISDNGDSYQKKRYVRVFCIR